MAAKAASDFCNSSESAMLAMKMNVWEKIRLFSGDLSLAVCERERERQVGLLLNAESGGTEGKTNKTKAAVEFRKKKQRMGGEIHDRHRAHSARMELSDQGTTRPTWSFWVTRTEEEDEAVCVCVWLL